MRGYQAQPHSATAPRAANAHGTPGPAQLVGDNSEIVSLLLSIRDELRRTREALETRKPFSSSATSQPPFGHV
jgi:hypothetical protein